MAYVRSAVWRITRNIKRCFWNISILFYNELATLEASWPVRANSLLACLFPIPSFGGEKLLPASLDGCFKRFGISKCVCLCKRAPQIGNDTAIALNGTTDLVAVS